MVVTICGYTLCDTPSPLRGEGGGEGWGTPPFDKGGQGGFLRGVKRVRTFLSTRPEHRLRENPVFDFDIQPVVLDQTEFRRISP